MSKKKEVPFTLDNLRNSAYWSQAEALIRKSLEKGCDVVELGNGDILTIKNIIIGTKYEWNQGTSKLIKIRNKPLRNGKQEKVIKLEVAQKEIRETLTDDLAA